MHSDVGGFWCCLLRTDYTVRLEGRHGVADMRRCSYSQHHSRVWFRQRRYVLTDHFSGLGRALGPVCVCIREPVNSSHGQLVTP